eukprot:CAMPEP_0206142018 /NCGR_PEP_ID=MMETSP1473-20131121/15153_1 /ASSEMBLY_ACC=CAM_ASM_001109 /TAXON_ID=1461547 /ORGANISM="Stichococcus sp, Strain RCC1054" /LENGTH=541 /DNA_ID=CAMNT_0053536827 /DNA_START=223 /DNA_END=1844 /DNA_ORIENTATION=-
MPSQAKPSGSGGAKRANAAEAAAHVAASRSGERPSGRAIKQNGSGKSRQTAEREAEQKRPLTAEQRRQLANKVEVLKRDLVHRVLEKKINGKKVKGLVWTCDSTFVFIDKMIDKLVMEPSWKVLWDTRSEAAKKGHPFEQLVPEAEDVTVELLSDEEARGVATAQCAGLFLPWEKQVLQEVGWDAAKLPVSQQRELLQLTWLSQTEPGRTQGGGGGGYFAADRDKIRQQRRLEVCAKAGIQQMSRTRKIRPGESADINAPSPDRKVDNEPSDDDADDDDDDDGDDIFQDAEEEPTLEGEPASNRGQVAAEGVVKGTADGAVGSDASDQSLAPTEVVVQPTPPSNPSSQGAAALPDGQTGTSKTAKPGSQTCTSAAAVASQTEAIPAAAPAPGFQAGTGRARVQGGSLGRTAPSTPNRRRASASAPSRRASGTTGTPCRQQGTPASDCKGTSTGIPKYRESTGHPWLSGADRTITPASPPPLPTQQALADGSAGAGDGDPAADAAAAAAAASSARGEKRQAAGVQAAQTVNPTAGRAEPQVV